MRPELVDFLLAHGLPHYLAPDYAWMIGLAGLLTLTIVTRAARADGEDPADETRTLIAVYVAALAGGYVYEWLRHVPDAIAAGSMLPILRSGRAAWGGVIFGSLAGAFHLRVVRRAPIGPFFDRMALAAGPTFFLVRFGCFLAGCDFGAPTASPLGVRFPGESLAALDHATRGWVPLESASLPVHPTQLYEGTLALGATLVAWSVRRGLRTGRHPSLVPGDAFLTWLGLYSLARFAVEELRADDGRGTYGALSTAQWTSLGVVTLIVLGVVARRLSSTRGTSAIAAATLALVMLAPTAASAQVIIRPMDPGTPAPTTPTTPVVPVIVAPPPTTVEPMYVEPAPEPRGPRGPRGNVITMRLAGALSFAMVAPQGSDGAGLDLDVAGQIHLSDVVRFEIGGSLGLDFNRDLTAYRLHARAAFVPRPAEFFEFPIAVELGAAFLDVKSGFFSDVGAFALRFYGGPQFRIDDIVLLTLEPIAFQIEVADALGGASAAYRPRILFGLVF